MKFTKKSELEVMDILINSSNDEIIHTLLQLRMLIVLGAVTPLNKALFTNDLLHFEVLYRGLKL